MFLDRGKLEQLVDAETAYYQQQAPAAPQAPPVPGYGQQPHYPLLPAPTTETMAIITADVTAAITVGDTTSDPLPLGVANGLIQDYRRWRG